jgi:hypothetical protein
MSEWQPIESAPKDGTKVDVWCVREGKVPLRIPNAYFYEERWLHSFNGMRIWHDPTHWMPLPPPPSEEQP